MYKMHKVHRINIFHINISQFKSRRLLKNTAPLCAVLAPVTKKRYNKMSVCVLERKVLSMKGSFLKKALVCAVLLALMAALTVSAFAAGGAAPLKPKDMRLYVSPDTTLSLGDTAEGMTEALGEYESMERLPSCLFTGEDHVYYYNGLTIYAHPEEDAHVIDEIQVTSQDHPTRRGVWVGTDVSTVIERYGRRYEKSGDTMSYYITKQMRLIFTIENSVVVKYSYYNVPIS